MHITTRFKILGAEVICAAALLLFLALLELYGYHLFHGLTPLAVSQHVAWLIMVLSVALILVGIEVFEYVKELSERFESLETLGD
jgi:hypothetical protein